MDLEKTIAENPSKFRVGQKVGYTYETINGHDSGTGIVTGLYWEFEFRDPAGWEYRIESKSQGTIDGLREDELSDVEAVTA